ncbi:MAG: aldehyde dehydrogenase family protein [Gemmataceae bacterium]|nr:aldehyde dehydrogenase family protein [Gemmataceae bacterium]
MEPNTVAAGRLETRISQLGKALFSLAKPQQQVPFTLSWWEDRVMEFTMANEPLKVELFRFIDALPALKTPSLLAQGLGPVFQTIPFGQPFLGQFLPFLIPQKRWPGDLFKSFVEYCANRMARKFIAGANLEAVTRELFNLRRSGQGFTVDVLGEATMTEKEAEISLEEYTKLARHLAQEVKGWEEDQRLDFNSQGRLPRANISIKLSSLDSQFDPIAPGTVVERVSGRIRPLLRFARDNQIFIYFDMEQYALKDLVMQIFQEVLREAEFREWPHVGLAIQVYLKDTRQDLENLCQWARERGTPVWVRLVKGAYWDYETIHAGLEGWPSPVWEKKWETDASYEEITTFLLENRAHLRPAFASHNIRSVSQAIAKAEARGIPAKEMEFQVLYGMGKPIGDALTSLGYRVRVYTPYGELIPGMAYLVRRLLENTANDSFIRAAGADSLSEERLLMKPMHNPVREQNSPTTPGITPREFRNEPLANFSSVMPRTDMTSALARVRNQLGKEYAPMVSGKVIKTQMSFESVNPSRKREVVGRIGYASPSDAMAAMEAAERARKSWGATSWKTRADLLRKTASLLRKRKFDLAAWQILECGKNWREADADVCEAIDFCDYYAATGELLGRSRVVEMAGELNKTFLEPRGVAVVIAPWNFPLAILAGMSAAALVTGNTLVMKPAEQSSVNGALWHQALLDAGFPPEVIQFLPGKGEEIGPVLVNHPATSIVAFTGSRKAGLSINRSAAEIFAGQTQVKKVIAEMGGKNAILIDANADLDEAVAGVTASAMDFQGQKCSACSRVLVPREMHNLFLQRLVEAIASRKIGPGEDPQFKLGPVIDEEAQNRIEAAITAGRQAGKLVYRGDPGPLKEEGFFVGPAVFTDTPPESPLCQEEIFGPVVAVIPYATLEEALQIANGVPYALTGGFYSRSNQNIERVAREFHVGNLYINRKITGALVHRQPFGGFKMSGVGSKAGGADYLLQFLLPRTITENTLRRGFAPDRPASGFNLEENVNPPENPEP